MNISSPFSFLSVISKPMKSVETILLQSLASLYNGKQQLPGTLILTDEHLLFTFDDFSQSHLNLQIPINEIEQVEEFLIFNISRHGLKITSKDGHLDLFVLNDPAVFRKAIAKLT